MVIKSFVAVSVHWTYLRVCCMNNSQTRLELQIISTRKHLEEYKKIMFKAILKYNSASIGDSLKSHLHSIWKENWCSVQVQKSYFLYQYILFEFSMKIIIQVFSSSRWGGKNAVLVHQHCRGAHPLPKWGGEEAGVHGDQAM